MQKRSISVTGLGYVGLPIAMAFARVQTVLAFDIHSDRIAELKGGIDRTKEVSAEAFKTANIYFTTEVEDLKPADFHIVTVPTPIDKACRPDLSCLEQASRSIARILKKGDIVVFESTVYPGVTEEECLPILEKNSGLKAGEDFFIGYSPERINPGDPQHSFTKVQKVVAGQTPEISELIKSVYAQVIEADIYIADSIRIAEAAKVIENTQRDLNIAFMNELAIIFAKMGLDTQSVLGAARTKWNFLPFEPGLVGGHCIGVDPYYLTYKAQILGYHPEVILSGRRINDGMGKFIAEQTVKQLISLGCSIKGSRIALLGLTFKENCPDLRNSRVIDVINELKSYGVEVLVHDPIACPRQAKKEYQLNLSDFENLEQLDAMIVAVAHRPYRELSLKELLGRFRGTPFIADVKGIFDVLACRSAGIHLWRL